MRKSIIALFLIVLCVFLTWQLGKSRTIQLFGDLVNRVDTTEKVVALTFDDGPMPGQTQTILRILRENDVKASFFLVGEAVKAHPEEARMIISSGHEVGNHSFTHQRMMFKSYGFIRDELQETDAVLRKAGASGPIHFRPPYGKKLVLLPFYLWRNDVLSITWDLEPESYNHSEGNETGIAERVIENARPGSIILLHVMFKSREGTMNAVGDIIQGLKAKGYRFVTVSELLKYRET